MSLEPVATAMESDPMKIIDGYPGLRVCALRFVAYFGWRVYANPCIENGGYIVSVTGPTVPRRRSGF